jgi:hypothetical protein
MARVNVEQKAFTDARFGRLGLMLVNKDYPEVTIDTAQCLGIGRMAKVWNECQERGSYTLGDHDLVVLLGHRDAAKILIESGLGERATRSSVRICGTEGRIEWLNKSRENGRLGAEHGKKGGRPKLTPDTPEKPQEGLSVKPPPAPAPALNQESFNEAWEVYPRKLGKTDAQRHYRSQVKTRADHAALLSAIANYRRECDLLAVEDRFIKHGSTFFNGDWRDYVDGVWKPPSPGKGKNPPTQGGMPGFTA